MTNPYSGRPTTPAAPAQPAPPAGRMRRRAKFWIVVAGVWFGTFSCTGMLMTVGEDGGSGAEKTNAAAKVRATPTVTATATATVTAEPEPAPTVTETVEVKVTETVTREVAAPPADGGDDAFGGDSGIPAGPGPGPDVDCSDLPGPVRVGPGDPHRLDRDGDGIGCDG